MEINFFILFFGAFFFLFTEYIQFLYLLFVMSNGHRGLGEFI